MLKDLRYSLRGLRRSPLFTLAAVVSLALGIGANTAIFSLLDQVVLRSLPVRDPERLVVLHNPYNAPGTSSSDSSETVFSNPMYRDLRDRDAAFEGLVARMSAPVRLAWSGNTEAAHAEIVSGNFFRVLGIGTAIGRALEPADDGAAGAHPVAVLGHAFWTTHFAGSSAVLGQTVALNGQPFTVVGVVDARFRGLIQGDTPDVFIPIAMEGSAQPNFNVLDDRRTRWLNLFGRLKASESLAHAQAATNVVYHAIIESELPGVGRLATNRERDEYLHQRAELRPAAHGLAALSERWEKPLDVLMVMVGLVLLIACANVAGLMMARAAGRQREIAIRMAIGAGRGALVRQLLMEGLLLALAGGAAGLVARQWSTAALLRMLPSGEVAGWLTPELNVKLFAFTLALAGLCGLLFALLPALAATRPDLASALKTQSAGLAAAGRGSRVRPALVMGQVALSVLLVVGAGLFSASAANLLNSNLGFSSQHLLSFNVNATLDRQDAASAVAFYQDLTARLAAIPGVTGVGTAIGGPFSNSRNESNLTIEGYHPREDESVGSTVTAIGPGFFRALEIPLRAGREFELRDDAHAPSVVMVNEAFARKYFAGRNPLGSRLMFGASNQKVPDREIVGVVADSRTAVRDEVRETVYLPYAQSEKPQRMVFYARTVGPEDRLAATIRQVVRAADSNLPAPEVKAITLRIRESLYTDRLIAGLATAFGVLATLMSAIGLYGVIAYAVARRTAEIGLRMALGALPGDVLRMVLGEAGRMAAIGIGIGLAAAFVLSRLVESQLFGVKANDPPIYAGAALVLAAVAMAAALAPGWRASRIEPVRALKDE